MIDLASVRQRPAMYVGGTDETGVTNLVLELVANVVDQHLAGRCTRLSIEVAADGTVLVEDNGPGIAAKVLDAHLTLFSSKPTVDGHRPHVHLGLGGVGLAIVNALSERLQVTSVHRGSATKARYARGAAVGRVTTTRTTRASGTSIRFRPDPRVFLHPRVSRAVLSQHLDDLSVLSPGLDVHGSFAGDALAAAGLAGRVAALIPCAIADVAHHRETYKTSRGPAAVEVALAWDRSFMPDRVDSFVNLQRTRDHGSHVDGMLDATKAFLASDTPGGLVGAVSVVLADVAWGTPTKNRLTTPEIRKPVAIATARALKAWERANPARAAAARGRRR